MDPILHQKKKESCFGTYLVYIHEETFTDF